jgi:hypothetical protein
VAIQIFPYLSPRLIQVPIADGTSITIQSLVDQIRDWEDRLENMAYPFLLSAAGKEVLGGGESVGITVTLQNARLAFEARTTPEELGTATTADAAGLMLIDSTALFQTNGVVPGAIVINHTTGGAGTVLTVDSETQLTHQALMGGSRDDWQVGDVYGTHNTIACDVSGGNLVAVDDIGGELNPIFPTAFTQVTLRQSTSAAAIQVAEIATTDARVQEVWTKLGLNSADPFNVDLDTGRAYSDSNDIDIDITGDGITSSREVRQ